MKRLFPLVGALVFAAAAAGCDSVNDDDERARLQATWEVTQVRDDERDLSTEFQQLGAITVEIDEDNFDIVADPAEGDNLTLVDGTYTAETATNTIAIVADVNGQSVPIAADYRFEDDDTLELTLPIEIVGPAINFFLEPDIDFAGDIVFRLERSSD